MLCLEEQEDCAICLETPSSPKKLHKCGHVFCTYCIDQAFKQCGHKCPLCGTLYGVLTGTQPTNGTMRVQKERSSLPGLHCGTIVITYSFPGGIQDVCTMYDIIQCKSIASCYSIDFRLLCDHWHTVIWAPLLFWPKVPMLP